MEKFLENVYKIDDILIVKFYVISDQLGIYDTFNARSVSQLFYMKEKGVFQDIFVDQYIPGIALGYSNMKRFGITICGLNKIPELCFTAKERRSRYVTESRLLEIYLKLNKLEKCQVRNEEVNRDVVGDMLDNIFVSNFSILSDCDGVDGYYNGQMFSQLFCMIEKGVFKDLFVDKYISAISRGYSEIERSTITLSGSSKLLYSYLTDEEIESGTITEDRLLQIYFQLNGLEERENVVSGYKNGNIVDIKRYIRERNVFKRESNI